ncbi:ParA family protein [Cobetia sp. AM6]|uniref:ParA family protein n=1 Tax=Cobetia sp. AM6 TaxID=2661553 RepID=UPI0012990580|nr:ParA family protein [Cobetia sp. AM6]BBO56958.1 cobyric acid synthase [Cobetia sp. AM6]
MTHIIAIANGKGGVGKTPICWLMAQRLSELPYVDGNGRDPQRVLCVDLDELCCLSFLFLEKYDSFEEMWTDLAKDNATETLLEKNDRLPTIKTYDSSIDLISGSPNASILTNNNQPHDVTLGYKRIRELAEKGDYKYILIDTKAGPKNKYKAAIIMADYVLIPATQDIFSIQGAIDTEEFIKDINSQYEKSATSLGTVFVGYQKSQNDDIQTLAQSLTERGYYSFKNNIKFSKSIKESLHTRQPLNKITNSYIAKKNIDSFVKEITVRIKTMESYKK